MALGFWQGASENHEICEALFRDLERRGLALSRRILFVTDGGSGLLKALRERFGKKLVQQRCAIHKSRNLQRHLAKPYRIEAHRRLMYGLGTDQLRRRQTDAAGAGGVAAGQERVGGGFASGGVRGAVDDTSAKGAGLATQDAAVDQPDREYVFPGPAQ